MTYPRRVRRIVGAAGGSGGWGDLAHGFADATGTAGCVACVGVCYATGAAAGAAVTGAAATIC